MTHTKPIFPSSLVVHDTPVGNLWITFSDIIALTENDDFLLNQIYIFSHHVTYFDYSIVKFQNFESKSMNSHFFFIIYVFLYFLSSS